MTKLFLAGLLAVSTLTYAGSGAPKAKQVKAKAKTNCSAPCAATKACKLASATRK